MWHTTAPDSTAGTHADRAAAAARPPHPLLATATAPGQDAAHSVVSGVLCHPMPVRLAVGVAGHGCRSPPTYAEDDTGPMGTAHVVTLGHGAPPYVEH